MSQSSSPVPPFLHSAHPTVTFGLKPVPETVMLCRLTRSMAGVAVRTGATCTEGCRPPRTSRCSGRDRRRRGHRGTGASVAGGSVASPGSAGVGSVVAGVPGTGGSVARDRRLGRGRARRVGGERDAGDAGQCDAEDARGGEPRPTSSPAAHRRSHASWPAPYGTHRSRSAQRARHPHARRRVTTRSRRPSASGDSTRERERSGAGPRARERERAHPGTATADARPRGEHDGKRGPLSAEVAAVGDAAARNRRARSGSRRCRRCSGTGCGS